MSIKYVESVRHGGGVYGSGCWAAGADGKIVYIHQLIAADMHTKEHRRASGVVMAKIFSFDLQALRAEVVANTITFRRSRLIQLLETCAESNHISSQYEQFPFPPIAALYPREVTPEGICRPEGIWKWTSELFVKLVTDPKIALRPIHFTGFSPLLDLSFTYR